VEFAGGWHCHEVEEHHHHHHHHHHHTSSRRKISARYRMLLGKYATLLVDEVATSIGYVDSRQLIESNLDFLLQKWLVFHKSNDPRKASTESFLHNFPIHLCGDWCTNVKSFVELVAPSLFPIVILQAAWEEVQEEEEEEAAQRAHQHNKTVNTTVAGTFRWARVYVKSLLYMLVVLVV
jgi:hypothetical protein